MDNYINVHHDLDNKQIHISDFVVFPVNANGSLYLKFGKVIKITEKTITIHLMEDSEILYSEDNNYYSVSCEPYFGNFYRLRNPNRCFVLPKAVVPSIYAKLLD